MPLYRTPPRIVHKLDGDDLRKAIDYACHDYRGYFTDQLRRAQKSGHKEFRMGAYIWSAEFATMVLEEMANKGV